MVSDQRRDKEISTESVTDDSVEVRIDVEAPPGVELAPEDKDTRQIDTKPLVEAAFEADDSSDELGFDRPIFDDPDPAASSPEQIAEAVRHAKARQSSPDSPKVPRARPAVPPPERAFASSVVVSSQDDAPAQDREGPTVRRLRAKKRLPTGPHMPQAGSARWDGSRRPLTGPVPAWEPQPEHSPAGRGMLFLVAGAIAGVLLGLGIGFWRDRSAMPSETLRAAPVIKQARPAPAPAPKPAPRPPSAADALAIPGSLVQLQLSLKLDPKELEALKSIRDMLIAGDWQSADVELSRLSPALSRTTAVRLWRARIDLFRGRAKKARTRCEQLLKQKLDEAWPAEVGLTLAEAELRLGDKARAKAAAEKALAQVGEGPLKGRIEALLSRLAGR